MPSTPGAPRLASTRLNAPWMVRRSRRPWPFSSVACCTGTRAQSSASSSSHSRGVFCFTVNTKCAPSLQMSLAWARTVCPASAVMTYPASGKYSFSSRSGGASSGTSFVFGPISRSASTRPLPWVTAASRYGMRPSVPGRAADRLAVHRDRGQPPRPCQGKRDRARVRAAGQVRPGMMRDALRAQRSEDPHHGLRVRRQPRTQRVPPRPGRCQDLLRGGVHPRGHVLDRGVPAQHRRRAQRQHAGKGMPDPARVPRVRDRGEAFQQVPAGRCGQRGGAGGQLAQASGGGCGHGHAKLNGQRGLPAGTVTSAIPVLAGSPLPARSDTRNSSSSSVRQPGQTLRTGRHIPCPPAAAASPRARP